MCAGDEQKKRAKREWQQSLRNSGKFKSGDAQRGPWGLSTHSPKLERRYWMCFMQCIVMIGQRAQTQQHGPSRCLVADPANITLSSFE